jgi:hypothetical protein
MLGTIFSKGTWPHSFYGVELGRVLQGCSELKQPGQLVTKDVTNNIEWYLDKNATPSRNG